jgi:hypothetical protein
MRLMATGSQGHGHNISIFELLVGKHRCRKRDLLVIFHVAKAVLCVSSSERGGGPSHVIERNHPLAVGGGGPNV